MSTRPATTAELIALVAPFVGARAYKPRDPADMGKPYPPQAAALDILAVSNKIDADVRYVTDEGIGVFFYSGVELVRWADVRRVTVREVDAHGNTLSQTVYEHRDMARAA